MKCDSLNCEFNSEGYCEEDIILEDRYCQTYVENPNKCPICGEEYTFINSEVLEHFGFLCSEKTTICACDYKRR